MKNLFSPGTKLSVFYRVCALIFGSLRQFLPSFSAKKAFYDAAYVDDLDRELATAKAMPDAKELKKTRKQLKLDVKTKGKKVRKGMVDLKSHIVTAFKGKEAARIAYGLAGSAAFAKGLGDMNAMVTWIDAAMSFIENNLAKLKENNNMPDAFQGEFERLGNDYKNAAEDYAKAENNNSLNIAAKADANKALYDKLMSVAADGQVVFKDSPANKRLFSYAHQKAIITGGSASFKGWLLDVLGNPVVGATVQSTTEKYSAVTDDRGYFKITRMKAAEEGYLFMIVKPGFVTLEEPVMLEPGTSHTVHLTMVREMEAMA